MNKTYIWATSEKSRIKALALLTIRAVVEKYGGTVTIRGFDEVYIDIPKEHLEDCARDLEEQVGGMIR